MCHKGKKSTNINRNPSISTKLSNKKPFNIGNSFNLLLHAFVTAEELLIWARRISFSHMAKRCENNWNQRGNFFRFLGTSKSLRQLSTMYSKP